MLPDTDTAADAQVSQVCVCVFYALRTLQDCTALFKLYDHLLYDSLPNPAHANLGCGSFFLYLLLLLC